MTTTTLTLTTDAALEIANELFASAKGGEISREVIAATLAPLGRLSVAEMKVVRDGFDGFAQGNSKKAIIASIAEACWKRGYLITRTACIRNA